MKDYECGDRFNTALENIGELALRLYDFFNPGPARAIRMAQFELLRTSGQLDHMCSSEVHELFGITRISNEY